MEAEGWGRFHRLLRGLTIHDMMREQSSVIVLLQAIFYENLQDSVKNPFMKRRLDSKLRKKIYIELVKLTTTFSLSKLSETFTFQNKGVTNLIDRKLSLNLNSEKQQKKICERIHVSFIIIILWCDWLIFENHALRVNTKWSTKGEMERKKKIWFEI